MANYEAHVRSNYFSVKDLPAFEAWCRSLSIEVESKPEQNPGLVTLIFDEEEGLPVSTYNENTHEHDEVNFFGGLASYLNDGQVAVIIEIGREKMRYLVGHAVAVNAAGEIREITLESIYELAQELAPAGADIIRAEY